VHRKGGAFDDIADVGNSSRYVIHHLDGQGTVGCFVAGIGDAQRNIQQQRLVLTAAVGTLTSQGVTVFQCAGSRYATHQVTTGKAGQHQDATVDRDGCRWAGAQILQFSQGEALTANGDAG